MGLQFDPKLTPIQQYEAARRHGIDLDALVDKVLANPDNYSEEDVRIAKEIDKYRKEHAKDGSPQATPQAKTTSDKTDPPED